MNGTASTKCYYWAMKASSRKVYCLSLLTLCTYVYWWRGKQISAKTFFFTAADAKN